MSLKNRALAFALLGAALPAAAAQSNYAPPQVSTPMVAPAMTPPPSYAPAAVVALSTTPPDYGPRLPASNGPWVLGDVRFFGNRSVGDYSLRQKVHAKRGSLYTPNDIGADVASILEFGLFSQVNWGLFATDEPIPSQYAGIVVSTSMVRLVFFVEERASATPPPVKLSTTTRPEDRVPPTAVSGVVFTPTAYRGLGNYNRPGLGLDFNGVYYIGRLYGKNHYDYTTHKTDYLDRIGQWFLMMDGKMQLQSEAGWRPAMAVGAQGIFSFRDAPQPSITTPGVSVNVSNKTTRALSDAYVVFSKKTGPVRSSLGYMEGNFPDAVGNLSEYLAPQALNLGGHPAQAPQSKGAFFGSVFMLPKPAYPLGFEFLKPEGMALSPILINLKIGYFLHLNFDVAYLRYRGAWDLLGMFQFRYNYFPSR